MQTETCDIVSIAIEIFNNAQLIKLNQKEPLKDIIQRICEENDIDYMENKYSLQFIHRHGKNDISIPRYVTENNRYKIQNGSELKLFYSATEFVKIIQSKLNTKLDIKELSWALKKLSVYSCDPTFCSEFFFTGYPLLRSVLEESSLTTSLFNNCLQTLLNLIKLGYISELDKPFLFRLKRILNSEQLIDEHIIENTLQILEAMIYKEKNMSPNFVTIDDLIPHIWNRESPTVQGYTIALINALALRLPERKQRENLLHQMNSLHLRETISKNIISYGCKSNFLSHNLYIYQTLILNLELRRFKKIANDQRHFPDMELNFHQQRNKLKSFNEKSIWKGLHEGLDFKSISKSRERSKTVVFNTTERDIETESTMSNSSMLSSLDLSLNLSIDDDSFVSSDLTQTVTNNSISQMTRDCILYFSHNYRQEYRKLLVEEFHLRFLQTSSQVIDLLVNGILKIGKSPLEDEMLYYPIVFSATVEAPFIEELFCCAMILLCRTRKEMKAKTEADLEKVFKVLKRQLEEGLAAQPISFNQLSIKLSTLTYSAVSEQWQEERSERERQTLANSPSVKQLRESLIGETLELIKVQRINYLKKGTQFPMWNSQRAQRIKNKTWFVCLSDNGRYIQYQENYKNEEEALEQPNQVAVSSIVSLVTGKKCPHVKESRSRPASGELAFSCTLNQNYPPSLDFIALNQETYDYWTDAINVLIENWICLGNKMKSSSMKRELNSLLEMELRIRLLETEGIELPQEPPAIPTDPPNYDFVSIQ